MAIQKSVTIVNDTGASGATPGDILEYRLNFQISDYRTIGKIEIEDHLSDGHLYLQGSEMLTVSDQFGSLGAVSFPAGTV